MQRVISMDRRAIIVTDLGYGDAGKGTMVDYLVRQRPESAPAVVVRYNGGPQAAHNVVTADGRHHTYAQFGSGSFVPGAQTHLSRYMLINPLNMGREVDHLQRLGVPDVWERLSVDEDAVVITPWQVAANQVREAARGAERHGSTGQGVGEARVDAMRVPELSIRVKDALDVARLSERLRDLRDYKRRQLHDDLAATDGPSQVAGLAAWATLFGRERRNEIADLVDTYRRWARRAFIVPGDYLDGLLRRSPLAVFEGAQGVLLDEWYGFQPYTTWSDTTDRQARALLREARFDGRITRLGVIRAFATRHGPGPFVTEDPALTSALPDRHNGAGAWQGAFRVGHLDLLVLRYALSVNGGVDALAVTHLDQLAHLPSWQVCDAYRFLGDASSARRFLAFDSAGTVTDLRPPDYGDYAQGCELAQLLMRCEPIYRAIPTGAAEALQAIRESLGVPIAIGSYGPTATDKRAL
jgi:adenylosuccinate synthase